MTDEQLLANFLSHRDGSAFEALLRRYGPMVLRVSRDILGDRDDAEDAFQATFLVLFRQAGSIREHASLSRWLYEVTCRISRRERRRVARLRSQERQAPEMDAAAPTDFDPADLEMKPILHDEIRRLPSKLRDAIVLCYFEGQTVEEAARLLRCPVGTLKSRLARGRELLRSRLTRRGLAASVMLLLMFTLTEESTAAVSDPLIESTVKAGLSGGESLGISRKVVSMIVEEETKRRWATMVSSWTVLLILVVVLGVSRTSLARKAQATAIATLSSKPIASPAGDIRETAPGIPEVEGPTHCQSGSASR